MLWPLFSVPAPPTCNSRKLRVCWVVPLTWKRCQSVVNETIWAPRGVSPALPVSTSVSDTFVVPEGTRIQIEPVTAALLNAAGLLTGSHILKSGAQGEAMPEQVVGGVTVAAVCVPSGATAALSTTPDP